MAHPHPPRPDKDSHLENRTSHHPLPNNQHPRERPAGGMPTDQRNNPATVPAFAIQGNRLIGRCHQIAEEEGIALTHISGGCHEGETCELAQRLTVQRLIATSGLHCVVARDAMLIVTGLPLEPRGTRRPERTRLPAPGEVQPAAQNPKTLYHQVLRDRTVQFTRGVAELHAEALRPQAADGQKTNQTITSQTQMEEAQRHACTAATAPRVGGAQRVIRPIPSLSQVEKSQHHARAAAAGLLPPRPTMLQRHQEVYQPAVSLGQAEKAQRLAGTAAAPSHPPWSTMPAGGQEANQNTTPQAQLEEGRHRARPVIVRARLRSRSELPAEFHEVDPEWQAQLAEALFPAEGTTPASRLPRRERSETARAPVIQASLKRPHIATRDQDNTARHGETGAPVEPTLPSNAMGGGPFGNGLSGGLIQWD
ncbi:MAG: hypothetical protein LQ339_003848 [Xanthoria mediterranea]|nr:MAG: hypothetical protein LQ339_003848 [Xanthoria mediterranea]